MAGLKNDSELPSPIKFLFNRSLTIHTSPKKLSTHPSSLNRSESLSFSENSIKGKVKRLCSLFETSKSRLKNVKSNVNGSTLIRLPGTEDRIVIYFTSLRGIRRTYEDCYAVRLIFRGFGVFVDERDVSMDSSFRKELESVLGLKSVTLPQVFIRGKHVGGVDAIKQLHEVGELAKIIQGFPLGGNGCDYCGDVRFLPCVNCSGSRTVFDEDDHQLKRCLYCNENGLIRCPNCCSRSISFNSCFRMPSLDGATA